MITRLQVRNFKSLRNVDISLKPLNVLVGPNMSGKSNILDVLTFLYQVFFPEAGAQGVNYALARRGGADEVLWKGSDDKLIVIAVETADAQNPDVQYRYSLEILAGAGGFASVQRESLVLTRSGATADLLGKRGLNQNEQLQYRNADGNFLGGISQSGVSAMQYAYPAWDGYRFTELVKNWRFYHFLPPMMKEPSEMASGRSLSTYGQNLSAWLMWLQTNSPKAFTRLTEVLRNLFPEIDEIKTSPREEGKVYLSLEEKGLKRATTVWQLSDGFLHLAGLLSLIYGKQEAPEMLLLLEEPENYLHPRLLETLVALLRQASQEASALKRQLTQVLTTTHSPYLVDQFEVDEIIWVGKKRGETKIIRPSDKKDLRDLIENSELGLGDLMYSGALGNEE